MNPLIQIRKNRLTLLCILTSFLLITSQSIPTHAGRMGGMGKKGEGDKMMMKSSEDRVRQIAEKLSLTQAQQAEVVYLLKNMFEQQSAYLKQAQDSDKSPRAETMEDMKELRDKTIEQVGDFLNDSQLAQLTELLNSGMDRPSNGRSSAGSGGGGRSF